jgi:fatty-acyl-CoA synthase
MMLLVGDLLADAAALRPSAVAATLGDRWLTYGDLDAGANRTANRLVSTGIGCGRTVAWWAGPCLESITGFAAVAKAGAIFAPINPAYGPAEAEAALEYLHPDLLVVDAERFEAAADLAETVGMGIATIEDLTAPGGAAAPPEDGGLSDESPHIIYLTSGTTGRPKGVVVSHRASWLRSFPGGSTFAVGIRGDGGILASFPLFHYGGWHYVLEAWHHRCAFHVCDRFDGQSLVDAAARWRPSGMYCIPAVWNRVLDASPSGPELDSVKHADTGTSAAPLELLLRLRERMPGATTSVLYGSSEGGHHTTLPDWDISRKPGSVGRVAPPGSIRLAPDGEILYRGPTLMTGYFERPEETATALEGGWYHTGDLGVMDDDSYLYVTGRAREVIRTGGETVAPPEVEAALAGFDGIVDAAVIGLPDDRWGEIVCAVVVTSPDVPAPTVAELRSHIGAALAGYKHPRTVVRLDAIPRTSATGQVQRTLLRDQVLGYR